MDPSVVEFGKYHLDCQMKRDALRRLLLIIIRCRLESWSIERLCDWFVRNEMDHIDLTRNIFLCRPTKEELVQACMTECRISMAALELQDLSDLIDARLLSEFAPTPCRIDCEANPENERQSQFWMRFRLM